jgi:hypothetical protein
MNTARNLTRIVAGMLLWVGVTVAGMGLGAGTATAFPPGCTSYACWCPGQPLPGEVIGPWDMTACHDWHFAWHMDRDALPGQILSGPLDCSYGPGFLPPCKG